MKRPPARTKADTVNEVCTVRMELRDSDPLIWREVEVPTPVTMKVLHEIIQIVMRWDDYHLWEFTVGELRFGPPMEEDYGAGIRKDAAKVRLRDVLRPRKTVIDYTYDFGDSWEIRLTITDVRQGETSQYYPRLVSGELAAPPEDCGGIPAFYQLLDSLADPKHPGHADASEQFDGYDPNVVDIPIMNFALGRIANRRRAAQVTAAKRKAKGRRRAYRPTDETCDVPHVMAGLGRHLIRHRAAIDGWLKGSNRVKSSPETPSSALSRGSVAARKSRSELSHRVHPMVLGSRPRMTDEGKWMTDEEEDGGKADGSNVSSIGIKPGADTHD